MAYEYSGQGSRLDFPNPFYTENWFYACVSAIALIGALALLAQSRGAIASHHGISAWLPLFLGFAMLIFGLVYGSKLFRQLRYFFGRGEPNGLAQELNQDAAGEGKGSAWLKQILRDNALKFEEPTGPLNGLLYAWLRNLIFSPPDLQRTTQQQFQTAIAVVVTLASFLVAWIGFSDPKAAAWMGLVYFTLSILTLVFKLDNDKHARIGMARLIALILIAIFAPVGVPLFVDKLPDITWLSLNVQTLFVLLISLLAVALYFLALMTQMNQPPRTNPGRVQEALSMNCHPKQLVDELERNLQDNWVELIPNRRYARLVPQIKDNSGEFHAELVEETQPMPAERERIGPLTALSLPRYRWIVLLEALGVLMVLAGTIWLVLFGAEFDPQHIDKRLLFMLTLGFTMLVLCGYCLRVGHRLWARVDFNSRLLWVDMKGNYQATEFNYGNDLTSQLKTTKRVINIETMTLQVWAAELDTVIFDKAGQRSIIGMRGAPDYAKEVATHLAEFAHAQSIIVAPTSQVDLKKADMLSAMNRQAAQATPMVPNLLQAAPAAAPAPAAAAPRIAAHCTQCGGAIAPSDRFCGNCGSPVPA